MGRERSLDELVAAARLGDDAAWAAIYRELAPSLLGYLRGRNAADPEDVLGELFVQIVRDIRGFQGGWRAFRAWTFAIAHHRLVDEGRRRARRPVELAVLESLPDDVAPRAAEEMPQAELLDNRIGGALRRLPQQQCSVVLLRVIGELTIDEVAQVMGKTPGAVKALQHRALRTLQREMSESIVTL